MKDFAKLFLQLDSTTKTKDKVDALVNYLQLADEASASWAVALLTGNHPKRLVTTRLLREWAVDFAGVPMWLFDESYKLVGDLTETMALILPAHRVGEQKPLHFWMTFLEDLRQLDEEEKKRNILKAWEELGQNELFVFNKLISGGWRNGVYRKLMTKALSKYLDREANVIAHRLLSNWNPRSTSLAQLFEESEEDEHSRPYPFFLAYPLEDELEDLGGIEEWAAEIKWDGIRGQVIQRGGELYIWSRGEDLVTDKFPEYLPLKTCLPDGTVLDGEILPFKDGEPLPLQLLVARMARKAVGKKTLENSPVCFMAYDLLEHQGVDIRHRSFHVRRILLDEIVSQANHQVLQLSDAVDAESWQELRELWEDARLLKSEGLMLKRKDSVYHEGRKRRDWWKWKVDPLIVDAVLMYAARGQGGRAKLYSEFTLGVWENDHLVPFTKSNTGLSEAEILEINQFVKTNTVERFGPVRSISPEIVVELSFEGIARSSRHKSGVMLRVPKILRIRRDKAPREANSLKDLIAILESLGL